MMIMFPDGGVDVGVAEATAVAVGVAVEVAVARPVAVMVGGCVGVVVAADVGRGVAVVTGVLVGTAVTVGGVCDKTTGKYSRSVPADESKFQAVRRFVWVMYATINAMQIKTMQKVVSILSFSFFIDFPLIILCKRCQTIPLIAAKDGLTILSAQECCHGKRRNVKIGLICC